MRRRRLPLAHLLTHHHTSAHASLSLSLSSGKHATALSSPLAYLLQYRPTAPEVEAATDPVLETTAEAAAGDAKLAKETKAKVTPHAAPPPLPLPLQDLIFTPSPAAGSETRRLDLQRHSSSPSPTAARRPCSSSPACSFALFLLINPQVEYEQNRAGAGAAAFCGRRWFRGVTLHTSAASGRPGSANSCARSEQMDSGCSLLINSKFLWRSIQACCDWREDVLVNHHI